MQGKGTNYVQLGKDFEAGLAPDLYIYASVRADIVDEESFFDSPQVELGKLIKGTGASFYELPCLLYTSPSPRDRQKSRMPSSA